MLRGTAGLAVIEALHIATAADARCDVVVTNHQRERPELVVNIAPLSALASPLAAFPRKGGRSAGSVVFGDIQVIPNARG